MEKKPFFTRDRIALLVVLILSAIVYLPAIGGQPILDDRVISSGAAIGGGKSFLDCFTHPFLFSYFRPMVSVTFWLERAVYGPNPFLMHQTNVLFHVLTTWLVVLLAQTCGLRRRFALLAGVLFAVQPAQVGAVAWIGGRTDCQACLFFVAMLLAVARFYKDGRWWWVPLGVVAAALGMLTKEQVLPGIFAAPLAGFAFGANRSKTVWASLAFGAAGLTFFAFWLLGSPEHLKGATVPLSEIVSQISRSTLDYALLLTVPNPWSMHTFSLESLRNPVAILLGAGLTLAIPYGIYRLWKRDRILGWLAISAALVYIPVSNLIPIPSLVAAPYRIALCGPSVAILLAVAASRIKVNAGAHRLSTNQMTGALAYAGVAAGLFLVPWGASRHANEVTLFKTCVTYDSKSFYMRGNYAKAVEFAGDHREALHQSEILLDQVYAGVNWHDYSAAVRAFRTDPKVTARILRNHGARAEAGPIASLYFVSHAQYLMNLDRNQEAIAALKAATLIDREDDAAFFGLGQLTLSTNPKFATKCLRRAMGMNPLNSNAVYELGHYYEDHGQYELAYRILSRMETMEIDTGIPLLDLANVEIKTGRKHQALQTLALASKRIVEPVRLNELRSEALHG